MAGRRAAAVARAVGDAAVGILAVVDVFLGVVDDFAGHDDAGVAAAAEALHLRDRGGAFVEVVAVLGADVAPAAAGRLGLAAEVAGLLELLDELLAALFVLFLAQHLREEEHREAVAVGVAVVGLRIADQAVAGATCRADNRPPCGCSWRTGLGSWWSRCRRGRCRPGRSWRWDSRRRSSGRATIDSWRPTAAPSRWPGPPWDRNWRRGQGGRKESWRRRGP